MIEKPTILITSIGRTGTEFFANFFAQIVPDCTSLHEPDIYQAVGVDRRLEHFIGQTRRAGIWRMIVLKALGRWTLADLSDRRFLRRLDDRSASQRLEEYRSSLIAGAPSGTYCESNFGYYGLLDITPAVFRSHRVIYIVRDGREWVRSALNWGEAYGKRGVRGFFSHRWPTAGQLPGDDHANRWNTMSRFERLCWAWSRLNQYALNTISKNPAAQWFQFERIFSGEDRYVYLKELVRFATSLPGTDPPQMTKLEGWLDRRTHKSSSAFPGWENWTGDQREQFSQICGPLMQHLGYTFG